MGFLPGVCGKTAGNAAKPATIAGRCSVGTEVCRAVFDTAVDDLTGNTAAVDQAVVRNIDIGLFQPDVFDVAANRAEQADPPAPICRADGTLIRDIQARDRMAVTVEDAGIGAAVIGVVLDADRLPDAQILGLCGPGGPVCRVVEGDIGGEVGVGGAVLLRAVGQIAVDQRGEPGKLLRRADLVGGGLAAVADLGLFAEAAPVALGGERDGLAGFLFTGLIADVEGDSLLLVRQGDGSELQGDLRAARGDAGEGDGDLRLAAGDRIIAGEIFLRRGHDRLFAQRQLHDCRRVVRRHLAEDAARGGETVDARQRDGPDCELCRVLCTFHIPDRDMVGVRD